MQQVRRQSLRPMRSPVARERKLRGVQAANEGQDRRGRRISCGDPEGDEAMSELFEKHLEDRRMQTHVL
jgi:hypothetical protein